MIIKRKSKKNMTDEEWQEHRRIKNATKTANWVNRNAKKVIEWRQRNKLRLIEYKGGKCEVCGYDKLIPGAYDFHHKNPEEKEFGISSRIKNLEACKKEVDKCLLVCKNCHAEIHYNIYEQQKQNRLENIK